MFLPVTTGPAKTGFFAMADEDILITLEYIPTS